MLVLYNRPQRYWQLHSGGRTGEVIVTHGCGHDFGLLDLEGREQRTSTA